MEWCIVVDPINARSCRSDEQQVGWGLVHIFHLLHGNRKLQRYRNRIDIGGALEWHGMVDPIDPGSGRSGIQLFEWNIVCESQTSCTAVGFYQGEEALRPWRSTGTHRMVNSGNSESARGILSEVSCASTTACTTVGSYSTGEARQTLAENWNGTKWEIQSTPNPATDSSLRDVSCSSVMACSAVGSYRDSSKENLSTVENWNGIRWYTQYPVLAGLSSSLGGVSCTSATTCIAVGGSSNKSGSTTLAERYSE